MSSLKYRLERLLPSLAAEARGIKDPEIKTRFYLVKAVVSSKKSIKKACESRGASRESFYKWARILLKKKTLSALAPRSRRPKKSPRQTPKRVEKRILKLRRAEPYNGPEVISQDLKRLFNIKCPPSTVYNVLKRNGMIKEEYRKSLTKKHMKRYRRPMPGYLQMDFKYVPYLIDGKQYYQLSCVDHHSSWRLIRCYRHKNIYAVNTFLHILKESCPFPIYQLQTDNDAAFTDKYRNNTDGLPTGKHPVDQWCKANRVEHKLIPIGQKELNGKVENTHKQDDRIFFSQIYPNTLKDIQRATRSYNERWNSLRRTKALGWKTPDQVVENAYVACLAWSMVVRPPEKPIEIAPVKKKRPKRGNLVSRYLQWMEYDDKMYPKAILPVSTISQNFSRRPEVPKIDSSFLTKSHRAFTLGALEKRGREHT